MESKTNYTIVGIVVVLLMIGLVTAGLWLSVGFDQKKYHFYIVYMREAVSGLNEDSLVKYNGVKVGAVDQITLSKRDPRAVKLVLKIQEGTPIFANTQASLISQGITGATYLGLSANSSDMTPLKTPVGEAYPVIRYEPSFLNQIEQSVKELSQSMKQFMSEDNAKNLQKTLESLQRITSVFARNDKELNETLRQFPELAANLRSSIKYFSDMSNDVSLAGKQLNITMQSGKDVLDVISQQAVPPAVSLLHRLDLIAANLEQVSAEMRQNPAILIRGTVPLKKGPGE